MRTINKMCANIIVDFSAEELFEDFKREAGKLEIRREHYYDHFLAGKNIVAITNQVGK